MLLETYFQLSNMSFLLFISGALLMSVSIHFRWPFCHFCHWPFCHICCSLPSFNLDSCQVAAHFFHFLLQLLLASLPVYWQRFSAYCLMKMSNDNLAYISMSFKMLLICFVFKCNVYRFANKLWYLSAKLSSFLEFIFDVLFVLFGTFGTSLILKSRFNVSIFSCNLNSPVSPISLFIIHCLLQYPTQH